MIPTTIHYIWFGKRPYNDIIQKCIDSWRKECPLFTFKFWNEETFDVHAHPFSSRMHKEKKWAFVADYARLCILEKEGGVYLDTDMYIVKNISPLLLNKKLVLGEESVGIISAGMIAASPHHPYIEACKKAYDDMHGLPPTVPILMTSVYAHIENSLDKNTVAILPPPYFYPYSQKNIHLFGKEKLPSHTYGIHMWNYSWGHPLNKLFKKIGIYHLGVAFVSALGIKKILKKILRFS